MSERKSKEIVQHNLKLSGFEKNIHRSFSGFHGKRYMLWEERTL